MSGWIVLFAALHAGCIGNDQEEPDPDPAQEDPAPAPAASDPESPEFPGIDEEEEDSDIDPGDTRPIPEGTPVPPPEVEGDFDAATWNIRNWFPGKNERTSNLLGESGDRMDHALFTLLDRLEVDVAALQEVYTQGVGSLPHLSDPTGTYTVLMGEAILAHRVGEGRVEYCPIVYRRSAMTCTDAGNWTMTREVHWARCEIRKRPASPARTFYMGCGHLTPNASEIAGAIGELFTTMRRATTTPTPGTDAFILGMDANSYWDGFRGDVWRDHNNRTTPPAVAFTPMSGPISSLTYTKMYKFNEEILVSKSDLRVVIDDLVWNVGDDFVYKSGTKRVANVQPHTNHPGDSYFQAYYELTDHLPVIASFEVR